MDTINNTPFETALLVGMGPDQNDNIVLIVKGTFELTNQQVCQVASRQLPIFPSEQFFANPPVGETPGSSVTIEGDYVIYKPKTDVILIGKAYAPGGVPRDKFDVSLSINGVTKIIRVIGDRKWELNGGVFGVSGTTLFTTMDLIFENAYGGIDPKDDQHVYEENPLGKGFYATQLAAIGNPLPNLEDANSPIIAWNQRPAPKGFAWYGKSWLSRRQKAGSVESYAPDLPPDFDWEFNNGAAPDLIRPYLRGDETILLKNCEPSGTFRLTLPGITPSVKMNFGMGAEAMTMVLDTLCIIMESEIEVVPDNEELITKRAYLVWRGRKSVDPAHTLDLLQETLID